MVIELDIYWEEELYEYREKNDFNFFIMRNKY